jgi:response regulator NasT
MVRSLLLVDPDPAYRDHVARTLDVKVARVTGQAADPDEAMRVAAMTRPDVAIVATNLHRGDGIGLVDRLAAEHGIPSILLSDAGDPTLLERTAESGVMGVLVRPVDPATLLAMTELAVCRFQETLALRREADALRRTLESRKVIERAKGLLMELEGIREQEAFARLRRKSMDTQRPMAEIARAVILAAELSGRTR